MADGDVAGNEGTTDAAPGLIAAGFHAVIALHESADEEMIIAAARERSVGLHGMRRYRISDTAYPPHLVLGFGNLTVDEIDSGIAAVGDLLETGW